MPMALVAVEQFHQKAQRVVDDGLALRMLPLGARMFVSFLRPRWVGDSIVGASEKSNPGIWGGLLRRKRYIDEKLVAPRIETAKCMNPCTRNHYWVWECFSRARMRPKLSRISA
jgi:hypothetical protein